MPSADTPAERLRENAVGITSTLVIGLGLLALFSGFSQFWLIFVLGFAVVVPIVAMVYGDEDEQAEWWDDDWWGGWGPNRGESRSESDRGTRADEDASSATDTPLETIRRRYARGELTDAQFERKLELLLETETLEDTEERHRARELVRERER